MEDLTEKVLRDIAQAASGTLANENPNTAFFKLGQAVRTGINELVTKIRQLEATSSTQKAKTNDLIVAKDTEIKKLQRDIEDMRTNMSDAQTKANAATKENEGMQKTIDEANRVIIELMAELQICRDSVNLDQLFESFSAGLNLSSEPPAANTPEPPVLQIPDNQRQQYWLGTETALFEDEPSRRIEEPAEETYEKLKTLFESLRVRNEGDEIPQDTKDRLNEIFGAYGLRIFWNNTRFVDINTAEGQIENELEQYGDGEFWTIISKSQSVLRVLATLLFTNLIGRPRLFKSSIDNARIDLRELSKTQMLL